MQTPLFKHLQVMMVNASKSQDWQLDVYKFLLAGDEFKLESSQRLYASPIVTGSDE